MSDLIALRLGALPWCPASTAEAVVVLDRYDIPLLGVVTQHGSYYLYNFLEGHPQEVNVWGYALIEDREYDELCAAQADELDEIVDHIFSSRETTVALATEDRGLLMSVALSPRRSRRKLITDALLELSHLAKAEVNAVETIREHPSPSRGIEACPV